MAKDKNCPKNNKDKKKTTMQIYAAREDKSEESEPYGGSQYSLEGEEVGFKNESQEEKGPPKGEQEGEDPSVFESQAKGTNLHELVSQMDTFEEDFEEIEESHEED